jgi:hypothetical protein
LSRRELSPSSDTNTNSFGALADPHGESRRVSTLVLEEDLREQFHSQPLVTVSKIIVVVVEIKI